MAIVAPEGSPLHAAVLSVWSLEESLGFYRDQLGMEVLGEAASKGGDFADFWGVSGTASRSALLGASDDPVGRIMLVEFAAAGRKQARDDDLHRAYGLFNLNFYSADIERDSALFRERGFSFWSDPVRHDFTADVGQPIEVIFNGPDGVAINLVELATKDPATRIGQMRAYVEGHGRTDRGFTPVVTTSHVARDLDRAAHFYTEVLDCGILIDEELSSPESNRFLRLAPDSRTRVKFIQGNHMFGKIALSEPVNYDCASLVDAAVAPNVGYIAQDFLVGDVGAAVALAECAGASIVRLPTEMSLPGLGTVTSAMVTNPGSGALQTLTSL